MEVNGVNITNDNKNWIDIFDHLIPVSVFSKGKTSKIMDEVAEKNQKYVILKNNQPKAMLISVEQFKELVKKAEQFDMLMEKIEDYKLIQTAEEELKKYDPDKAVSYDEVLNKKSIDDEEIKKLMETVEIE